MARSKKICVYTCITGEYDELQPIEVKEKNVDYVCFTNNKKITSNEWKVIYIEDNTLDNCRLARKLKMLGHPYISENYNISVWMDARIIFKKKVVDFVKTYLKNNSFAAIRHHARNCIYEEAEACLKLKKDSKSNILKTIKFLKSENYPEQNGLYEMTVFIKKHNDPLVIRTMFMWFNMICNYSKRDQLSFMYCVWKTGLKIDDINLNVWSNEWFIHTPHNPKGEITNCRVYLGEDAKKFDYELFYEIDYEIKNDKYCFSLKLPVDTKVIRIDACDVPCTEYKNLKVEGIKVKNTKVYNKLKYGTKTIFYNDYGFIYLRGDFKKGETMNFSIKFKKIEYAEILRMIEVFSIERVKVLDSIDEYEEKINELNNKLNDVYNSSSWKITKPIRTISFYIRKMFKKRK